MCLKPIKRGLFKFWIVGSNICSAIYWTCFPLHNCNRTYSTIHTTHSVLVFQQGPFLCCFLKWVYKLHKCSFLQLESSPGSPFFHTELSNGLKWRRVGYQNVQLKLFRNLWYFSWLEHHHPLNCYQLWL